jgi:hypothetical protein
MLDIYLIVLFLLVAAMVYTHCMKEHLTAAPPETPTEKRITKLEDEYKQLHNIVHTQEERMNGASSQAAQAKAALTSIKT